MAMCRSNLVDNRPQIPLSWMILKEEEPQTEGDVLPQMGWRRDFLVPQRMPLISQDFFQETRECVAFAGSWKQACQIPYAWEHFRHFTRRKGISYDDPQSPGSPQCPPIGWREAFV